MSISAASRNTSSAAEFLIRLFSLSAMPAILVAGLLIALTGLPANADARTGVQEVSVTTEISKPSELRTATSVHTTKVAGGIYVSMKSL